MDVLATGYPSFDYILPVSHSPGIGATALLETVVDDDNATYGGCGLNVAAGLAALGFQPGVAVVLGDDKLGYLYMSRLRSQRIDTLNVTMLPKGRTSRSYLFRNPEGEYQNFFFPGAADQWQGNLQLKGLSNVRYGVLTVGPYHYNRQFVEQVRAANVPLVWELKPDIYAYPAEAMHDFASASTYILMNHIEADFVCQTLGYDSPAMLLNGVTQAALVTEGAKGCAIYSPEETVSVPSVPTTVVDTTGAGDAFTAGILAGTLRGYDLKTSAQLGAVMASFALEKIGCQTNLPAWAKMAERYGEHFGALPQKAQT